MSAPPVPYWLRLQFEDRVRLAVTPVAGDPSQVCQAAHEISTLYPWADTRTVANTLVDILGTGYGAIYLHWTYDTERSAAT